MKKITITLFTLMLGFGLMAQDQSVQDIWTGNQNMPVNVNLEQGQPLQPLAPTSSTLFDNGPLVNSTGTGAGGADESVLQTNTLGMNTLGFGHQISNDNWVADDFTITDAAGWNITSFVFYAYQTGATTTSTMTAVHFIIYEGVPGDAGTSIVWGDVTTDRFTSTAFTNIYRVNETSSGNTDRPIMENTCNVSFHLDAGTYWVAWQTDGTLSSGPWAPPITVTGQSSTGNGMQSIGGLTAWNDADDSGTGQPQQGLPFIINGDVGSAIPVSNWALAIGLLLISGFIFVKFRTRMA